MKRLAALPVMALRSAILLSALLLGAALLGAGPWTGVAFAEQVPIDGVALPDSPVLSELERRPGEGERCIVCAQQIHGDEIVEVRYKGRTFFVAGKMLDELASNTDTYFQQLQAQSALFDERSMEGRQMSFGWLLFGGYVLLGLIFAALCGYLAVGRSLAPLPWFFAGLVGNLAALIVLLATARGDSTVLPAGIPAGLAKVPTTRTPVTCSECDASNHPSAAVCGGCGRTLSPTVQAETARI